MSDSENIPEANLEGEVSPVVSPSMPQKKNSKMIWGVSFLSVVLLALSVAVVYLYTSDDMDTDSANAEQTSENDDTDTNDSQINTQEGEEIETTEYVGDYVTAELPDGWSVVEYENGTGGYGLLTDVSYTGLTAIVIRDSQGQDVYTIEAVDGIGGLDICDYVWTFDDTPASYIQGKVADYQEVYPSQSPQEVSIAGEYIVFEMFGRMARAVGHDIYWDADISTSDFEPNCGMPASLPDGSGLVFDYASGDPTSNTYIFQPEDALPSANMDELIVVMQSLEVI